MKTGVGSANDNEPPCAFQGVNARSQSPGPCQESEGGFLELLRTRTTSTRWFQCPNLGIIAHLQMPAAPLGPGDLCHTAPIPSSGHLFCSSLEGGVFAKVGILMKKQAPHLSSLDLLGGFSGEENQENTLEVNSSQLLKANK